MSPSPRRYGDVRVEITRAPVPRLLREAHRSDDGDTDDRWASAVLLSYLGLVLVVGIAVLFSWSMGSRGSSITPGPTDDPPAYSLAK